MAAYGNGKDYPIVPAPRGALLVSGLVHVAAVGAVVAWSTFRSTEPPSSRVVFVDLASTTSAATGQPRLSEPPYDEEADEPSILTRRVAELTADKAELADRPREREQRTAQLEAEHREALAARDAAARELGEELGALVADRDALSAELAVARTRAAALEQEPDARRHAEEQTSPWSRRTRGSRWRSSIAYSFRAARRG